jgi:hypothetical protein
LDAFLVAGAFQIFGDQVSTIRIVQVVLYAITTFFTVLISYRVVHSTRAALLTGLLMAIPTVNVTLYTTVSLGGYGETLMIGTFLLLISISMAQSQSPSRRDLAVLGFLAGIAFWAFGLSLVFILPAVVIAVQKTVLERDKARQIGDVGILAIFSFLGGIPWLIGAVQMGFPTLVREMLGSAISGTGGVGWLRVVENLRNLIVFGLSVTFGLRPPWSTEPLLRFFLPIVLFFWMGVIGVAIYRLRIRDESLHERRLLLAVGLLLIAGFVLSPFGADPSGRYFVPLMVPLAILAGESFEWIAKRIHWGVPSGVLVLVVLFNLWGTMLAATTEDVGLTTQFDPVTRIDHDDDEALMSFLFEVGEVRGYSNYWVSYPLAFQSDERLIYVPRLPYHQDFRYTTRDDRYHPYAEIVEKSDRVAYITTNHPELDQRLREGFEELEISWLEKRIGGYQIFYHLSERVEPQRLKLGEDYP